MPLSSVGMSVPTALIACARERGRLHVHNLGTKPRQALIGFEPGLAKAETVGRVVIGLNDGVAGVDVVVVASKLTVGFEATMREDPAREDGREVVVVSLAADHMFLEKSPERLPQIGPADAIGGPGILVDAAAANLKEH